jgi:hypothetical protein
MRKLTIPLREIYHNGKKLEKPVLTVIGTGARTFLWVGDKSGAFSFTCVDAKENKRMLKGLADSLLNRISKP